MRADIQVSGLVELRKSLRALAPEVAAELDVELKGIAGVVARDARRRVPVRTGRARDSVRAGTDARGPYVKGGKKSLPYYGWLEFGSRTPRKNRAPWGGSGAGPKGGRFIYPAIAKNRDEIQHGALDALERAKAAAGLT